MNEFENRQFGKYLLLDRIAAGGMAELYRAKIIGDQGFEKLAVLKRILPHLSGQEDLVKSFIDEAKLAALLQHQNIVHIYDFGSLENSYFIAMEHLFGKDLSLISKKLIEKEMQFGLENALYITAQICKALDYAHNLKDLEGNSLNIIHRDISPQNVLITYDGEVKLVDFGIAKAASQCNVTRVGIIKGKVAYMSPEQAFGDPIDHRSDIFSVGILLYEMVTGKRMFIGDTLKILAKVQKAEFDSPDKLVEGLPPALLKIIYKALAQKPGDRYQTDREMLADIEECIYENSLRPDSLGLTTFMRDLFKDDIDNEQRHIRESTKTRELDRSKIGEEEKTEKVSTLVLMLKRKGSTLKDSLRRIKRQMKQLSSKYITAQAKRITHSIGTRPKDTAAADTITLTNEHPPGAVPATDDDPTRALIVSDDRAVSHDDPTRAFVATESGAAAPHDSSTAIKTPEQGLPPTAAGLPGTAPLTKTLDTLKKLHPKYLALAAPAVCVVVILVFYLLQDDTGPNISPAAIQALEKEHFKEAVALFEQDIQQYPAIKEKMAVPYSQALLGQAVSLAGKDRQQAKELLLKAVEINKDSIQAYFNLGLIYAKMNDFPRAIDSYKKAAELDPQFPETFFNLAYIYATTEKYSLAEEMYSRVVALAPSYLDQALFNLAIVQQKQNKIEQSIDNVQQAIKINPDNSAANKLLLKLKASQGDKQ